tara:strand:+ start:66099 stop:66452 length:354 start_codon:yes stop_codon:yes gene_type:complete
MKGGPTDNVDTDTLFELELGIKGESATGTIATKSEKEADTPVELRALETPAPTMLAQVRVATTQQTQSNPPSMTPEERARFEKMKAYFEAARQERADSYPHFSPKDDEPPRCIKHKY